MDQQNDLTKIPHQILQEAQKAGLEVQEKNRSGTFVHLDQETVAAKVNELYEGKIELMDIKTALKKYPGLKNTAGNLLAKTKTSTPRKWLKISAAATLCVL